MKNKDLEYLSEITNTSKPTVSKVMNHCFGVEYETRRKVLQEAERHNIVYDPVTETDVYVILPDTPKYFWSEAFEGLCAQTYGLNCKFNIYSRLSDSDLVEGYLTEACRLNAKILIISAVMNPKIHRLLLQISSRIPIIFLSEYVDIPNTFFVGSDSYHDGFLLGEAYLRHFQQYHNAVTLEVNNYNCLRRAEGFSDALTNAQGMTVRRIPLPVYSRSLASQLARRLDGVLGGAYTCVYCTNGILPDVCLAINKLGLKDTVLCIGHENPGRNKKFIQNGQIAAFIAQDMFQQGKCAMKLAAEYVHTSTFPDSKFTLIESKLFLNTGKPE